MFHVKHLPRKASNLLESPQKTGFQTSKDVDSEAVFQQIQRVESAMNALGSLTGRNGTGHLRDEIFTNFCLGK